MNPHIANTTIAWAAALILAPSLSAQNANYAPGDLVLFFQKEGSTQTVYVNLGAAATQFRGEAAGPDAASRIEFLDIQSTLVSAFGAGWASDPNLYAGLAGVYSANSTNATAAPGGDPYRTLYISRARDSAGTPGVINSTPWDLSAAGNSNMTTAASGIQSQNNVLETTFTTAVATAATDVSQIDDQNPLISAGIPPVTIQGPAMGGALDGGIQQKGSASIFGTMGAAGNVEFALDLNRVLARTGVSGQVAGVLREGSFEGTITVGTNGKVSFLASDFAAWALAYPALDTPAKRAAGADPDGDGVENLMEFVLGGNPASGAGDAVPSVVADGNDFVFSFPRRDDSEAEVSLVFEYGSDLGTWTVVPVGAGGSTSAPAVVAVTENGSAADVVTITIPKSSIPGGRLFGRVKAAGF